MMLTITSGLALMLSLVAVGLFAFAAFLFARSFAHHFADVRRRPAQLDEITLITAAAWSILMIVKVVTA